MNLLPPGADKKIEALLEKIRNPFRLRVASLTLLSAITFGVYWPITSTLEILRKEFEKSSSKTAIARDIETLRELQDKSASFLPPAQADVTWWLGRIRDSAKTHAVLMTDLSYNSTEKDVGGYLTLDISANIEASFPVFMHFLAWIESSTPRMKLSRVSLHPAVRSGIVIGRISLCTLSSQGAGK